MHPVVNLSLECSHLLLISSICKHDDYIMLTRQTELSILFDRGSTLFSVTGYLPFVYLFY